MPHPKWREVTTYPQHFHLEEPGNVVKSALPADPEKSLREFLKFARTKIKQEK
jgi:hypothetical protein